MNQLRPTTYTCVAIHPSLSIAAVGDANGSIYLWYERARREGGRRRGRERGRRGGDEPKRREGAKLSYLQFKKRYFSSETSVLSNAAGIYISHLTKY
jgi:hypothetical protein